MPGRTRLVLSGLLHGCAVDTCPAAAGEAEEEEEELGERQSARKKDRGLILGSVEGGLETICMERAAHQDPRVTARAEHKTSKTTPKGNHRTNECLLGFRLFSCF